MKSCSACCESKPFSEFYQRKAAPDGFNHSCRTCALRDKSDLREYYKTRSDADIEAIAVAEGPRMCRKCREIKSHDLFPRDRGRRTGRGTMCLVCAAMAVARYRETVDPEGYRARKKAAYGRNRETYRRYRLKKTFGITLEQYNALHAEQGGVCAICGEPERRADKNGRVRDLSVDHCHSTTEVRSLLCASCNTGLGYFRDSPVLLASAAEYIMRHRALQEHNQAT